MSTNENTKANSDDGDRRRMILLGLVPLSLYLPVGAHNFLHNSMSNAGFICAVTLWIINAYFLVKLIKEDEESKLYNYLAFCGSMWTCLHFGTIKGGPFLSVLSSDSVNFSVVSFIVALSCMFLIGLVKLVRRWREAALLYRVAYLFLMVFSASLLLYYSAHTQLVFAP